MMTHNRDCLMKIYFDSNRSKKFSRVQAENHELRWLRKKRKNDSGMHPHKIRRSAHRSFVDRQVRGSEKKMLHLQIRFYFIEFHISTSSDNFSNIHNQQHTWEYVGNSNEFHFPHELCYVLNIHTFFKYSQIISVYFISVFFVFHFCLFNFMQ